MKRFVLFVLISFTALAQSRDPYKILDAVKERFNLVNDYTVDVSVKLDINFIKVPETKAKIYFKQPDKVKLDSKGFAMLPRQGMNFSPTSLLDFDYTAVYVKSEKIDGHSADVIKVLPNSDSTDIILAALWVDTERFMVRKVEITGKKSGTRLIELRYDDNMRYNLPSQIKFAFNIGEVEMPPDVSAPPQQEPEHARRGRGPLKGSVIATYKNYSVNKGIDDKIFEEEKKQK